jgi:cell pole-organizing protein PopZ
MAQTNTVQREPSMEEILASIRKIIEESDGVRKIPGEEEPQPSAASVEPARPALSGEVEAFRADLARRHEPEIAPAAEQLLQETMSRMPDDTAAASEAGEPAVHIDDAELAAELASAAALQEPAAVAPSGEAKQGILSHHVQQQVAQSFGELSEAFLASRRKSFDEMAEEMLRPMLQDWLDNNLPVLVERLVREEIERVARGVTG